MAMADSGSRFFGDLNAVVAARTLSAAVCKLLTPGFGTDASIMKTQLCSPCDVPF